jgi:SIR2-like domain
MNILQKGPVIEANSRDVLARQIRNGRVILFVGAGVSMAVGLPSWQTLIDHLLEELELSGKAVDAMQFGHQMLAEYYRLKKGGIGPLRSWLDRNWKVAEDRVAASPLHRLVVELGFPVIYTTNYDRNLEKAYEVHGKPYFKITNARNLASAPDGCTQIVKYHGDLDDDASLVLTETDFFNRLSFDTALDIKFRADALGRTILFIGYSMSDPNIRLLLYRLWQLWEQSGFAHHRPQSFIFMPKKDVVQEAILARWGITVINPDASDGDPLVTFLSDIRARSRHPEGQS